MSRKPMFRGDPAQAGQEWFAAQQARIARGLCEEAAAQPTSLLLEQWASMTLGWFWNRRRRLGRSRGPGSLAAAGEPILRSIAGVGSPEAKLALRALGRIDRGALGQRALRLADELCWPVPPWVEQVGTTQLVEAFYGSSPGDGEVVMLRSDSGSPLEHMVTVYIDERHRGLAKHVALLHSFDPRRPETSPGDASLPVEFQAADVAKMCRKVADAIRRTDAAAHPPVDASFSNYRAIALARLSPLEG